MSRRQLKVWAWSDGVANFGDELGPRLLAMLGYDVVRVPEIAEAELVGAGSILESVVEQAQPGAIVWGSGLMHDQAVDLARLDVRAVRGKLTAARAKLEVPTCDPGSLVPLLYKRPRPRYRLGVVRHYVDEREYPWADIVINASWPVDEVIAAIGSCRKIASSSLHGLVVASAWGIPTLRLHHTEVAGGDFKWSDWFSGDHDTSALLGSLP